MAKSRKHKTERKLVWGQRKGLPVYVAQYRQGWALVWWSVEENRWRSRQRHRGIIYNGYGNVGLSELYRMEALQDTLRGAELMANT